MDEWWTFWGDPHAKPDNLDKIEALFDFAEAAGYPVLILGDLLDNKEVIRGKCLNLCIRRIRESKLRFRILVGNHDWHNLECQDHSLRALALLPNVEIVDQPGVYEFGKGLRGFCVPYINKVSDFENALKRCPKDVTFLVMHQGVTGFDYGNGRIAEEEDGIIPEKLIKRFKMVISGHFHAYQARGNLTFLGTPFSHSHGESNQRKYIGTLNTKDLTLQRLPTPFPQHMTVTLGWGNSGEVHDVEESLAGFMKDGPQIVRAILEAPQDCINQFNQARFPEVKFIERPSLQENESVKVTEADSNDVKFKKWAQDIKRLDAETVSLGLEILESVRK